MSMDYETAMEGVEVSRREAVQEYRRHGLDEADLIADLGDRDSYDSREVLLELGY